MESLPLCSGLFMRKRACGKRFSCPRRSATQVFSSVHEMFSSGTDRRLSELFKSVGAGPTRWRSKTASLGKDDIRYFATLNRIGISIG